MQFAFQSVLTAVILASAGQADAGPFEDGQAAYQRHDYATALQVWRPLADRGDPNAQIAIGTIYAKGEGVPRDYAEAVRWFRKAADQGSAKPRSSLGVASGESVPQNTSRNVAEQRLAPALYNIDMAYVNMRIAPQNYSEALKWLALARFSLGAMYDQGRGVAQNFAEAMKWYRKAADQGQAVAQYNLGLLYAEGRGVALDFVQAYTWFDLAASRAEDAETRDNATHNRNIVAENLSSAQIAEAQSVAHEWRPVESSKPPHQLGVSTEEKSANPTLKALPAPAAFGKRNTKKLTNSPIVRDDPGGARSL